MRNAICLNNKYVCQQTRFPVWQKFAGYIDTWRLITFVLALTVALPLAVILWSFSFQTQEIWQHLARHMLTDLLLNTTILAAGVLTITLILGVSLAWLTGVCDFPGRKIFSWALLLPIAMPTYVLAFVTLGIMDYSGPVQTFFRTLMPASKKNNFEHNITLCIIAINKFRNQPLTGKQEPNIINNVARL